jgi:hypothetical protein
VNTFDDLEKQIDALLALHGEKIAQVAAAIKQQVRLGENGGPSELVRRLVLEAKGISDRYEPLLQQLQKDAGVTEEELLAMEREELSEKLHFSQSMWRDQILRSRSTADLDELAAEALDQLSARVSPKWLREQAEYPFRLSEMFTRRPVHIVNGIRVNGPSMTTGQNRFAQMLLLCKDHLDKRIDLDFFSASLLIPELAAVGNSLREIESLGPEGIRKLDSLQQLAPDAVSATVFELLVGSACIAKGTNAELLPETKDSKVPDLRLHGFGGIPAVIECKRRLGLGQYELREAAFVEQLYGVAAQWFKERGIYGCIEATFIYEVGEITQEKWIAAVHQAVRAGCSLHDWGEVQFAELPAIRAIEFTRIYSQTFLEYAYGWHAYEEDWDGIMCEVNPTDSLGVEMVRRPICLKWKSTSDVAMLKKARGITSLWHRAVKQIPPGEVGFIYIAYPEGARTELADQRTKHILETMPEISHEWYVQVPVTVISRLYPRALYEGRPDLIENVLPGVAPGEEHWLMHLPHLVFTREISLIGRA